MTPGRHRGLRARVGHARRVRAQVVANRNQAALLAATGMGSASLAQARAANAALLKQDAASLAADSGAPLSLQVRPGCAAAPCRRGLLRRPITPHSAAPQAPRHLPAQVQTAPEPGLSRACSHFHRGAALQAIAGVPAAAPAPQSAAAAAAAAGRPTSFLQASGGGGGAANATLPQPLSSAAPQALAKVRRFGQGCLQHSRLRAHAAEQLLRVSPAHAHARALAQVSWMAGDLSPVRNCFR